MANKNIQDIILLYNPVIKGIEQIALDDINRAYGGVIRAAKGTFVEDTTKLILIIIYYSSFLNFLPIYKTLILYLNYIMLEN